MSPSSYGSWARSTLIMSSKRASRKYYLSSLVLYKDLRSSKFTINVELNTCPNGSFWVAFLGEVLGHSSSSLRKPEMLKQGVPVTRICLNYLGPKHEAYYQICISSSSVHISSILVGHLLSSKYFFVCLYCHIYHYLKCYQTMLTG